MKVHGWDFAVLIQAKVLALINGILSVERNEWLMGTNVSGISCNL